MHTLHEQQRAVADFICAEGDTTVATDLALKHSAEHRFSDAQRLQVYRNNTAISLHDALAAVYPVIQQLVGEAFFRHVARDYSQRHPSRSGNLHDFGAAFADHLNAFPGARALPYLQDVARLEWAYHQVFHAPETARLNLAALAALDEAQIAALRFQLSATCRLLASPYPVLRIWQANQAGADSQTISLDEGGAQLALVRHAQQVEFYRLSVGVFALLDALAKNHCFARACECALTAEADCDIGGALQLLLRQRMLSGCSHPSVTSTPQAPESGEDDEHTH